LARLSDQDAINTRVPDRKQRKQCEDAKRRYVPRDSYYLRYGEQLGWGKMYVGRQKKVCVRPEG